MCCENQIFGINLWLYQLKLDRLNELPVLSIITPSFIRRESHLQGRKSPLAAENSFLQTVVPSLTHSLWIFRSLKPQRSTSYPWLVVPWLLTFFCGREAAMDLCFNSTTIFKSYIRQWKMNKGQSLLWRNI